MFECNVSSFGVCIRLKYNLILKKLNLKFIVLEWVILSNWLKSADDCLKTNCVFQATQLFSLWPLNHKYLWNRFRRLIHFSTIYSRLLWYLQLARYRNSQINSLFHQSINPSYKQTGNVLNVKTIIIFGGSNSHNDVYWSMRQWYMHLCMNLIHIYSIFGFSFNADTDTGEQRQCTNWSMPYTNIVCECVSQCKWTNSICVSYKRDITNVRTTPSTILRNEFVSFFVHNKFNESN